jgi:hypothetical protein
VPRRLQRRGSGGERLLVEVREQDRPSEALTPRDRLADTAGSGDDNYFSPVHRVFLFRC